MHTLCRDCGCLPPADAGTCPACGSARVLRHPELHDLAIAHLDCDAFYAAIEKRDRPELADVPVIVGGRHRGVVAACCYVARTYGVRSAMPMYRALRLCPEATVVRPDMKKYAAVLFRRLSRERLVGLFRRSGAGISHIVPVLPDGCGDHRRSAA